MRDDTKLDDVLREALAGPVPHPSAAFRPAVMRRLSAGRLGPWGVAAVLAYVLISGLVCALLLRDLPLAIVGLSLAFGASAAAVGGAYASRLAGIHD